MELRTLGNSDLAISPVGIGTAPIGSGPTWRLFWGPQSRADSTRAIHTALDMGVNWIDTAPFYGWGAAEELVGQAVAGRRDSLLIFTKCGVTRAIDGSSLFDLRPGSLRREVEGILRRLKTDRIDLLQFHDVDEQTPIEESWGGAQQLIQDGLVRYLGLSNHTVEQVGRALRVAPVTSVQEPYSLLRRGFEDGYLAFAERHGIGTLAWSPLASGLLAEGFKWDALHPDDFRRSWALATPDQREQLAALREDLSAIAQRRGKTLTDLALAWVLRHQAVTGAIVGIRNAREARTMTGALDWNVEAAESLEIEAAVARARL